MDMQVFMHRRMNKHTGTVYIVYYVVFFDVYKDALFSALPESILLRWTSKKSHQSKGDLQDPKCHILWGESLGLT